MKIKEYFKHKLEELFLNTKVNSKLFQHFLDEHFNGIAKIISETENELIVSFKFEDVSFKYKMNIIDGFKFHKIGLIEDYEE